jgi:hypothetical protein
MIGQVQLQADCFDSLFVFERREKDSHYIEGSLTLTTKSLPTLPALTSLPFVWHINDLEHFHEYITHHLNQLSQNVKHVSKVITPIELGFTFQLMAGDWETNDQVEFDNDLLVGVCFSRVMLCVGKSTDGMRVYMGAEGYVDFDNLRAFADELVNLAEG